MAAKLSPCSWPRFACVLSHRQPEREDFPLSSCFALQLMGFPCVLCPGCAFFLERAQTSGRRAALEQRR